MLTGYNYVLHKLRLMYSYFASLVFDSAVNPINFLEGRKFPVVCNLRIHIF